MALYGVWSALFVVLFCLVALLPSLIKRGAEKREVRSYRNRIYKRGGYENTIKKYLYWCIYLGNVVSTRTRHGGACVSVD